MLMITLINIFAATALMTALYTLTRPVLDRAGSPYPRRPRLSLVRGRKSRLRERRSAVLLAICCAGLLLTINSLRYDGSLGSMLLGLAMIGASVAYWVHRGRR